MKRAQRIAVVGFLASLLLYAATWGLAADTQRDKQLVGLWRAKRHFGPEIRGTLTLEQQGGSLSAEIAGYTARPRLDGDRISFELADSLGSFRGTLKNGDILGHWIQPSDPVLGYPAYATPVTLVKQRSGYWRGTVAPLDLQTTFYLRIKLNDDTTLGAFLRNPERNAGRFFNIEQVATDGRHVKLLGRRSKGASKSVLAEGTCDAVNGTLSLYLPSSGGTFDFRRATPADQARFLPRAKSTATYTYRPPPAEDDGWSVATLDDVGISRDGINRFVQMLIDTPIDSVHASDVHGVLIARHGKLVLEEYFHGFHRELLHDTRSASKSLTSVLTGAAVLHGDSIGPSTPVYKVINGADKADLDPRKGAMTVEHLLTMSAGLDCDDANPASAGNEDAMQEQSAQPDWYRFTLDLKMVRAPGERAVYGSALPNLLGGVLARTTGRWLPDLFHDLVAEPLQIQRYAMNLTPTGDAYMGGGVYFLPRDFMKLGQMILDGGRWNGHQVVSADWARKSVSPLYELRGIHYGYLWWVIDYPYKNRTVRAFFAGGNGGQIVMGVPELDLVIAFYGGNYGDPVLYVPQRVYVSQYILPAVD
jgi:CubicO group peptidase (beta-lactamase class C family)